MDEDDIIINESPSEIYELWAISTYIYGPYDEAIKAFQGDAIYEPQYAQAVWWEYDDMANCAEEWCRTVLVNLRIGRNIGPFTDDEKAQLKQIEHDTQSLWDSFKLEFRLLACTKDKKYKALRAQLAKMAGQKTQLAITSAMASGFAMHMGVTISTILTPLCAICLLAGAKIGREVLCNRLAQSGFQEIGVELGFDPRRPV